MAFSNINEEGMDKKGLAAAIATTSVVGFGIALVLPLLSITLETRGVSANIIGLNTAMAGIAAICITPFVARLAERIGTIWLLLIVIAIAGFSLPLFYLFDRLDFWFLNRLIYHGSVTAIFVLSEFWISALAPEKKRGFILGIYATALSIGFAAGPSLLAITGSNGPLPYFLGSILILSSALPVFWARHSAPIIEKRKSSRFFSFLFSVPIATFGVFIFGAVEFSSLSLIPVYGLKLGLNENTAALLVSAFAIGNVVSQIPLGLLSDKMDRRILLLICATIGIIGALAIPLAGINTSLLFTIIIIWGGFIAGLYTVGLAHLGSRHKGADLADANSAFIMMYSFGSLMGPIVIGTSMDIINPYGFAYAIALFFLAYILLSLYRIRSRPHQ